MEEREEIQEQSENELSKERATHADTRDIVHDLGRKEGMREGRKGEHMEEIKEERMLTQKDGIKM